MLMNFGFVHCFHSSFLFSQPYVGGTWAPLHCIPFEPSMTYNCNEQLVSTLSLLSASRKTKGGFMGTLRFLFVTVLALAFALTPSVKANERSFTEGAS